MLNIIKNMNNIKQKEFTIGYGKVKKAKVGKNNPLVFIGGPCAIESRIILETRIKKICDTKIGSVFKSCFNKDCESSPESST